MTCWPAKSLSRAIKSSATSGPAHWSQVRCRITIQNKTTTKNNLCAPRELHADRCASSDTAQVAYSIIPRETVGPIYIIKLEKLNDYGRICLADWRAVLYDHQGRPPTPHTPIPLTLAPIIFPPPPMGPCGRGGVGKPGSLSIELCLAGSSSTAKAHRSLQNRLDGVNKTFAARGNDIKPNTKSQTRCSINSAIYYQRRKLLHATSSILRDPRLAFPDASSGCAYSVTTKFCACGSDWTYVCSHTLSSLSTTTFSLLLVAYILVLRMRGSSPRYPGPPPDAHKTSTVV